MIRSTPMSDESGYEVARKVGSLYATTHGILMLAAEVS
jgi:hypothetical protein